MRADRLLSILLLLQVHSRLTARYLAKRLEVSERTIHRDMGSLGAAGVPVVAERGAGGGWSLMPGYRTNVSGLTDAEVQALFVTKPSRLLADLRLDKASDGALVKLLSVLPAVNRRGAELARQRIHIDVSGWNRSREPVPHLPALQQAVWSDRRVKIIYDRGEGCANERLVDPLGLVAKGSVWYLVAAIDGDIRSYRVSRIREAAILEDSFVRPPDFDLCAFWERSAQTFRERLPRFAVVIRARTDAVQWVQAMTQFGGVDEIADDERSGWKRLAMHFDAEEVARVTLLGLGTAVEVIEPEGLRDLIVAEARAVAERG
jgi:predicted DNA-binding transcriptional regulator YafY